MINRPSLDDSPSEDDKRPALHVIGSTKQKRIAAVIAGIRDHEGYDPPLDGRDKKAIADSNRPAEQIVAAYGDALRGEWPPGDHGWLRNHLSISLVVSQIAGYEAWVTAGRPRTDPARANGRAPTVTPTVTPAVPKYTTGRRLADEVDEA